MKKAAACIRMLQLLKSRGFMTREQLAKELETNIRNIIEYRKELEQLGYTIESSTGKYGGYRLVSGELLPVIGLYEAEISALMEARTYLESHKDFLMKDAFHHAMDKILSSTSIVSKESGVYVENQSDISKELLDMIKRCEQARDELRTVEIEYRSMHAKSFEMVRVQPYEIINVKGSYYCLGYSLKAKAFRNYKFSEERMKSLILTNHFFSRDVSFKLQDHIGQTGLMKDETIKLEMLLYDETALLISEKKPGILSDMKWIDERTLYLSLILEGKMNAIMFLLSLGNKCKLLSPLSIKEEIKEIVKDMASLYS